MIQAVLFSKTYSQKQIKKWLEDHKLKSISHRTTNDYHRYRILTPDYDKYIYRILKNKNGPDLIMQYKII
jgi:hypothetical protein